MNINIIQTNPDQSRPIQTNPDQSRPIQTNPERTDTLRLTQEFNDKVFNHTRKSIDITNLSIMKDDIKNYRPLTDIQLTQIEDLTENEKIEIIKTYNIMFASIENVIN
jgi:hypothetical protein